MDHHLCADAGCPYNGKPSPGSCGCHKTENEMLRLRIVELEAANTSFAKFLLELREKLSLFVDDIEDEGDRVYLGSTNHADYLREAEERMNEIWCAQEEPILLGFQGRDLYAELRALHQHVTGLENLVEAAKRAIGEHSAPDDCYATGPLTGDPIRDLVECPACSFATMLAARAKGGEA